jgi:hypothetical protein
MKKIPPFKLIAEPLNDDAKSLPKFQWASPEVGQRHQLGGDPSFIQAEQIPQCSICGKKMTFYAQLDSINDEYCLADVGMIYVFVCFSCFTTQSFLQSG